MKTILLTLVLMGLVSTSMAAPRSELENRIIKLDAKFEALQQKPDKAIPAEQLEKAKGIILLDRTKAGFIFGYQGGSGVAMAKDPKTKKWSAPVFMNANEASLGFQIGGQQTFVVMLLMSTNAVNGLTDPKYKFGGEASGTAGDESTAAEGEVTPKEPSMLLYTNTKGLYGGATIKGGSIEASITDTGIYYGKAHSLEDILFEKKAAPSEAAVALTETLVKYSKKAK
ncbi:MAG TPA: lipid-binding SYLF domain-containing protein [Roseimicrobium sp.]|nr:lipid-binding SYLF domain-containing protein [Roseimicrobium sp.]